MESRGSKVHWENRLKECSSFAEKAKVLEELLLFLEEEILQILGDGSNEREGFVEEQEKRKEDLLEAFVEALEALRRREERTISAPPSRRKALREVEKLGVEDLSLEDLLRLYAQYLGEKKDEGMLPDAEFERLLEERQKYVLALCDDGVFLPMERFFEDCKGRRAMIATFLVLLDLVFRGVLGLRREEDGGIFLGRIAESP